jgi:hypothetical protein
MALTTFVNGTVVQPSFLNSMYYTAGGHVHDGALNDGHAPKISLDTHLLGFPSQIQGILPEAHLPNIQLTNFRSGLSLLWEARHITMDTGCATAKNVSVVAGRNVRPLLKCSGMRKRVLTDEGGWAPWSAGADGGAIPSAASGFPELAGGIWLHCFLLGKLSDRDAFDFGFDTTLIPNHLFSVATGWNLFRRIGSILISSSSQILKFYCTGRRYTVDNSAVSCFLNLSAQQFSLTQGLVTTSIPPGVNVQTLNRVFIESTTGYCTALIDDYNHSSADFPLFYNVSSNGSDSVAEVTALSDTYQRIMVCYMSTDIVGRLRALTYGWIEDPDSI